MILKPPSSRIGSCTWIRARSQIWPRRSSLEVSAAGMGGAHAPQSAHAVHAAVGGGGFFVVRFAGFGARRFFGCRKQRSRIEPPGNRLQDQLHATTAEKLAGAHSGGARRRRRHLCELVWRHLPGSKEFFSEPGGRRELPGCLPRMENQCGRARGSPQYPHGRGGGCCAGAKISLENRR